MPQKKRFTDEELRQHHNARSRQRYADNREVLAASSAATSREWYARNKEQAVAASQAYRQANPDKVKAQNAKRRAADPEKARAEVRAWFAANPEKRAAYEQNRRAKKRERGGRLAPDIHARLMKLQTGKCACCRVSLARVVTHLDHIQPLALGGSNTNGNMQLLCQPCNQSKHAKDPVTFMQERGFLL